MSVTLQPILKALGYEDAAQQRAVVKLLQASGSFGDVKGVSGILTDPQADAILRSLTFNDPAHALNLLHEITQEHMLRRPPGVERHDCVEPEPFKTHRAELLEVLNQAGQMAEVPPAKKHYDHVLVLGATEEVVNERLDTLKRLWEQGVRFDKIHMLGSHRPLIPQYEPSADVIGPNHTPMTTEMGMMESAYYKKSADWPPEMQNVRIFEVDTYNKPNGDRANTQDTVQSWVKTNPAGGDVLVVSSQPYVKYQDAAVKSALPELYHADTVGDRAASDIKISVAMDTIARQIDVALPQVMQKLEAEKNQPKMPLAFLDPASIQVDAPTYQFRSGGDAQGVTESGRYHAERWDPVVHGDPILVHKRLDGSVFVADGHHRVALAKELNMKGVGPGKLAAVVLDEAEGYTAKDVKIIAAYKNIAHGHSNTVDAARVFKEAYSGEVHTERLPQLQMDKGNLKLAFTMSHLSDKILDDVAKGEVAVPIAAKLAEFIPDNPERQESVLRIIRQKLNQSYSMKGEVFPSQVMLNTSTLTKEEKPAPGFVEKLAQQRASATAVAISRV